MHTKLNFGYLWPLTKVATKGVFPTYCMDYLKAEEELRQDFRTDPFIVESGSGLMSEKNVKFLVTCYSIFPFFNSSSKKAKTYFGL